MKSTITQHSDTIYDLPGRWSVTTGEMTTEFRTMRSAAEQIATLQQEIERLREEVRQAREAARLCWNKMTLVGSVKEHNKLPGYADLIQAWPWLEDVSDE